MISTPRQVLSCWQVQSPCMQETLHMWESLGRHLGDGGLRTMPQNMGRSLPEREWPEVMGGHFRWREWCEPVVEKDTWCGSVCITGTWVCSWCRRHGGQEWEKRLNYRLVPSHEGT